MSKSRNELLEDTLTLGTIPGDLFYENTDGSRRLKVQSTNSSDSAIIAGFGYTSTWAEISIAGDSSVYCEFTVPIGMYMALSSRVIATSGQDFLYRVFPQGSYTIGGAKVDDGDSFAKTRNMRQGGDFKNPLVRHDVAIAPNDEDQIIYVHIFGAGGQGNSSIGGTNVESKFLLLQPNQTFLLELRNKDSSTAAAEVTLDYAFIPEQSIPPLG